MTPLSIFEYLYRDSSNYKIFSSIPLRGDCTLQDAETIRENLHDREYFIPEAVGLRSLQTSFVAFSPVPSEDDHEWHEFVGLRAATAEDPHDAGVTPTTAELVDAFRKVGHWDPAVSPIHEALKAEFRKRATRVA